MKPEAFFNRIALENVSFGYAGKTLWKDLSFDFPLDTNVWVRAELGAGSSSLMRMLGGILPPTSGTYYLNDVPLYSRRFHEVSRLRTRMGFGFEEGGLLSNLTLEGNLLLPLRYHGLMTLQESSARAELYLKEFDLWKGKDLRPAHASAGMRRSCVLARALILEPELLILDEPTGLLHPTLVERFKQLIAMHRSEKNLRHVIATTQDETFFDKLNPVTIRLKDGLLTREERAGRKSA